MTKDTLTRATVRDLKALGISEYAARTLVTLTRIGGGTARDVSEASSVPRTRVYDAGEELAERDLVTVSSSDPKRFDPVDPRTVGRRFRCEYLYRLAVVEGTLTALADPAGDSVSVAVDSEDLLDQRLAAIRGATRRLRMVCIAPPDDAQLRALADATDRGVEVTIAVVGAGVDQIRAAAPDCTVQSLSGGSIPKTARGQVLLADDTLAVLDVGDDSEGPPVAVGLTIKEDPELLDTIGQLLDLWLEN